DEAAMKLIFMGLKNISKKWTMPIRDWGAALNQFAVIYGEDRVPL
ncbi:MAG: IS256 family transposase, partial [Spirochaetaceae bacterium]|nr:IS256 family transposase [Spirochaetaceae bacterium]